MNKQRKGSYILFYIILVFYSVIQVFPFYLKLVNSLQPRDFIPVLGRLYLYPESINLANYIEAWNAAGLGRGYINSLIYVTLYTAISAVIVVIAGYVLAKKKFRGNKLIFFALISTMMVPGEVLFIPNYLLIKDLGMLNSLAALIVPGLVNTFGIFLTKQFFMTIPDSILESVYLEGASELTIIRKIMFPLAAPAVATYSIITYTSMWNEYIWPQIVLTKSRLYPVQLALKSFDTDFKTPYYDILNSAGMIMTFIPVVVIFLIFQKKFVEGVSLTGIK